MSYLKSAAVFLLAMMVAAALNMALILLGPFVISTPAGFDNSSQEAVKNTVHLLGARHFVFPLLAHALGTLAGAWLGARFAPHGLAVAIGVGLVSLLGGVANIVMIASPLWFEVVDALLCYLPMAWLGYRLGGRASAG